MFSLILYKNDGYRRDIFEVVLFESEIEMVVKNIILCGGNFKGLLVLGVHISCNSNCLREIQVDEYCHFWFIFMVNLDIIYFYALSIVPDDLHIH